MEAIQIANVIVALAMLAMGIACVYFAVTLRDNGVYPVTLNGNTLYTMTTGDVIGMLATFCFLTCAFHCTYAAISETDMIQIDSGKNKFRWMEYSLTASLMAVSIALLANTSQLSELMCVGVGTGLTMLIGLAVEKGGSSRALMTSMGWILISLVWAVIWMNFSDVVTEVPGFVVAMTAVTMVLFLSFGFVQLAQVVRGYQSNRKAEYAYVSLSALSKTFLVIIVLVGMVARNGDQPVPSPPP